MIQLLVIFQILSQDPQDVSRLANSARDCTWAGTPEIHLAVASVVAQEYRLEPELLLSIAHHESCYDNRVITGHASGVMQTIGHHPETLIQGYEFGAAEIQAWMLAAHGNLRVALAGYSGGWAVMKSCRDGGACGYADVFLARARRLRSKTPHQNF